MKRNKRITIALIRDGPDPCPMLFTGRTHEMAARRAIPIGVAVGYVGTYRAKKQSFDNRFHYSEEKIMNKDDSSIVCQRCCRCCAKALEEAASISDIATWIAVRRYDILDWVDPVIGPSGEVVVFDIWIDPKTHEYTACPWLRRGKGTKKYGCAIHDVKPEVCRTFPVDMKHAKSRGCPACQEKSPGNAGQGSKAAKPRRDGD